MCSSNLATSLPLSLKIHVEVQSVSGNLRGVLLRFLNSRMGRFRPEKRKSLHVWDSKISPMTLSKDQKDAVLGMMDRYAEMYSAKNLQGLLDICAPGICGYGSGVDEVVQGIASMKVQTKRDFAQADTITIRFDIRNVDGEMPVAWVMADCIFDVKVHGTPLRMIGRMTAVLRTSGSRWHFTMIHFSVPALGQAAGESFPGSR